MCVTTLRSGPWVTEDRSHCVLLTVGVSLLSSREDWVRVRRVTTGSLCRSRFGYHDSSFNCTFLLVLSLVVLRTPYSTVGRPGCRGRFRLDNERSTVDKEGLCEDKVGVKGYLTRRRQRSPCKMERCFDFNARRPFGVMSRGLSKRFTVNLLTQVK